jgi:hypothetical protein
MGAIGVANLIQGTVLREWVGDDARPTQAESVHTCGCVNGDEGA